MTNGYMQEVIIMKVRIYVIKIGEITIRIVVMWIRN